VDGLYVSPRIMNPIIAENPELIDLLQELQKDETIVGVLKTFIFPVLVALITFYATFWLKEWRDRKRFSLLGKAICESLLEEVKNGVAVMKTSKINQQISGVPPRGSWDGMKSIPDTALERILMMKERSGYSAFPVSEIRIHSKNYFDHIIPNFMSSAGNLSGIDPLIEGAEGVQAMLEEAIWLLDKNSKSMAPK